jgi:hypothetical protein
MHFAVSTRVFRPTSLLIVATMENKVLDLGLVTYTKIMILQVIWVAISDFVFFKGCVINLNRWWSCIIVLYHHLVFHVSLIYAFVHWTNDRTLAKLAVVDSWLPFDGVNRTYANQQNIYGEDHKGSDGWNQIIHISLPNKIFSNHAVEKLQLEWVTVKNNPDNSIVHIQN